MQCSTAQHSTTQHNTAQQNTTQHSSTLSYTALHCTILPSTAFCCPTQHNTAKHNKLQYIIPQPILSSGYPDGPLWPLSISWCCSSGVCGAVQEHPSQESRSGRSRHGSGHPSRVGTRNCIHNWRYPGRGERILRGVERGSGALPGVRETFLCANGRTLSGNANLHLIDISEIASFAKFIYNGQ